MSAIARVSVTTLGSDEPLVLELGADATVESLKDAIQECKGIPPIDQKLVFKERLLEGSVDTLRDCGIEDGSVIGLVIAVDDIKITVRVLQGQFPDLPIESFPDDEEEDEEECERVEKNVLVLDVRGELPVNSLLDRIQSRQGGFQPNQSLVFRCGYTPMNDLRKQLSDYGIEDGSEVTLCVVEPVKLRVKRLRVEETLDMEFQYNDTLGYIQEKVKDELQLHASGEIGYVRLIYAGGVFEGGYGLNLELQESDIRSGSIIHCISSTDKAKIAETSAVEKIEREQ